MPKRPKISRDEHEAILRNELRQIRDALHSNRPFNQHERANLAERARLLNHASYEIGDRELWQETVQTFHEAIPSAYPPGFWEDVGLLKHGDLRGLEMAVRFLESDPWFFRSGYVKADLIDLIKRVDLPSRYIPRIQQVVLNAIERGDRREFRRYCRLARKVDSKQLREAIAARLDHPTPVVRRHARWMLDALDHFDRSQRPSTTKS